MMSSINCEIRLCYCCILFHCFVLRLNLELFKARDVMHSPVITITPKESAAHLSHLLLETTHGGFPVVKYHEEVKQEVAYGLLTRSVGLH
jgi:chloride channel 7